MLKQKILRYLSVLCSLLVMTGMTACAAQGPTESVSQSAESASRPAANIPWAMDSAPQTAGSASRATASSSSQALRTDSSSKESSSSSSSVHPSQLPREESLSFAADVPQDMRRRVIEAEEVYQLDLTDLSFRERCQLLLLWRSSNWNPDWSMYSGIGLVDLKLEGCPALCLEFICAGPTCAIIYDLSGDQVQIVDETPGLSAPDDSVFKRENALLQEKTWDVFSTVFPDGTSGGIIQECGNHRGIFSIYFTMDDEKCPLWNCMSVYGSTWKTVINQAESGEEEQRANVCDWELYCTDDNTWVPGCFPDYNRGIRWIMDESTQEEFLESVKGSWLDVLINLPRDPWLSPIIHPDESEYARYYPGLSWQEIEERVQALIAEYNLLLEQGGYDLPPVS